MAVLPTGIGPVTGGYQIERSLRFNSADFAYLNRTPASASNRKTWTWSGWVKRSALGSAQRIFVASDNNLIDDTIGFLAGDTLTFYLYNSSYQAQFVTTQVFRDPSSWYHIIVAVDTTQATSTNRVKIYVNGVQVTAFSTATYPTQNLDASGFNTTNPHNIGRYVSATQYFNGYLTEVNFINGQALTPSDFGETDSATGVWKPKAYTGTYGTNGFFLKFADNSGTTSTTLGKDSSGNGNNWTPNNFSVTAGAGNDSLVDSPTSYGTDTGVGGEVRGNYCTWNSAAQSTVVNGTVTRSDGNLVSTDGGTTYGLASIGTIAVSSGKWYWEVVTTAAGGTVGNIGIVQMSSISGSTNSGQFYQMAGFLNTSAQNTGISSYGASYTVNDVIGVALNMDAGTVTFYKNGVSQGQAASGLTGLYAPAVGDGQNATSYTFVLNAGQRAFAYTAPSGFKALCTTNLPTPTIGSTSTTQANDYFNVVTFNGNGGSNAITGVGFQPDFVWVKSRSNAYSHNLHDVLRGPSSYLVSNSTAAENTSYTNICQFTSDGFTLSADNSANVAGTTNVGWAWDAGGTGVTNTAGTITSTVRANTTSGFSIVTYTGTGANATVGHGLGVAPSMIIVKNRSSAQTWRVYSSVIGATQYLNLNATTAAQTSSIPWNNTAPTSTVFSVGTDDATNKSSENLVAYAFAPVAGYSAFGSYVGNGSTDGPFVYLGFRPRFIMVKRTDTANDWILMDALRLGYNQTNTYLEPNTSDAETTDSGSGSRALDILSNGFKNRDTSGAMNANGGTYIYAAFAESPFKYALAR